MCQNEEIGTTGARNWREDWKLGSCENRSNKLRLQISGIFSGITETMLNTEARAILFLR